MKKEVHYSFEAEQAVLGCMLAQPKEVLPKFDETLKFSDFFTPAHRILAEIICYIDSCGRDVDVTTVHQELCERKLDKQVGSPQILAELLVNFASHLNVGSYIDIVLGKSKYRALMKMAEEVKRRTEEEEPIQDILDSVQGIIDDVITLKDGLISHGKAPWSDLYAYMHGCPMERQKEWLKTGFGQLDACLNGLRPGRSYVIAARPGIGKTAKALNIIRNLLLQNIPCGMISLEMGDREVRSRIVANHASVDTRKIENGLDEISKAKITAVWNQVERFPLHVLDQSTMTASGLKTRIRQLVHLGCRVVFIDYIQLLSSEDARSKKSYEVLTEATRAIKVMTKLYNIPIVTLVQLNREKEGEPDLENLAGSDSVGRDADAVIIMFKEGDSVDYRNVPITWKIAKNRQGPRAKILTNFDGPLVRFTEKSFST